MKDFIVNNQGVIIAVAIAAISEFMALNPNSKANGILQFIVGLFGKKK